MERLDLQEGILKDFGRDQLRPCVVTIPEKYSFREVKTKESSKFEPYVAKNQEKHNALFHRWHESFWTIGESPLVGGPSAGQMSALSGVVEYEDGTVHQVNAEWIQFVDGMTNDFYFPESEVKNGE